MGSQHYKDLTCNNPRTVELLQSKSKIARHRTLGLQRGHTETEGTSDERSSRKTKEPYHGERGCVKVARRAAIDAAWIGGAASDKVAVIGACVERAAERATHLWRV